MRKTGKTLVLAAMAAVATGMTSPALAATARHEPVPRSAVAFTPGSGQSVVDWNRELITILGTPGAQPATVHPTRSFAILQAAGYDAVTSITRAAPSYRFTVPAPRGARPDAAADQAAHDVLTALYPALKAGTDQRLPRRRSSPEPSRATTGRLRRSSRHRCSPTGVRSRRSCSAAGGSSVPPRRRRSPAPPTLVRSTRSSAWARTPAPPVPPTKQRWRSSGAKHRSGTYGTRSPRSLP